MKLLNQKDFGNDPLFSQLQGNILKGHGRDHTNNLFLQFTSADNKVVKKWIADFSEKITSCKKQLKENEVYKRHKIAGDVFFNFSLSAAGYTYLGQDISKFEPSFQNGMKNAALNDPAAINWERGFSNNIHALILVADDDLTRLGQHVANLIKDLEEIATITTIEYGNAIRNSNGDGIEHFGYVDGISQPLFFEDEVAEYVAQNGNKNDFDPSASTDLVLVDDPLTKAKDAFGSYFVFRKLEQNVRGFKDAEIELGQKLGLTGEDAERAGAMIVGRFEDGTPVTITDEAGMIGSGAFNNFNYNHDNNASKCPFHSHIRKTNPRRDANDKTHIMARRGIPFGHRYVPTEIEQEHAQMPQGGVGLLFMSYQKSIANQFEFIQKTWTNNTNFPHPNNGLDPIIGQNGHGNESTGAFAQKYGDVNTMQSETFASFVNMKGGEYFFAPSITFLKGL